MQTIAGTVLPIAQRPIKGRTILEHPYDQYSLAKSQHSPYTAYTIVGLSRTRTMSRAYLSREQ